MSAGICHAAFGYCTLITTSSFFSFPASSLDLITALWACPIDAAPHGTGSIQENISSTGRPSSLSKTGLTVSSKASQPGTSDCKERNFSR